MLERLILLAAILGSVLTPAICAAQSRGPRGATAELTACRRSEACVALVGGFLEPERWQVAIGIAPLRIVRVGPHRRRGDADLYLAVFADRAARERFVAVLREAGDVRIGDLGIEQVLPVDAQGVALDEVIVLLDQSDTELMARVEATARQFCANIEISRVSAIPGSISIGLDLCGPIVDVHAVAARVAAEPGVRSAEPNRVRPISTRR